MATERDAAADNAFAQNRLARLVAVFLTALIRNRVIAAGDLLLDEVAAFATRYSRVKESAMLYKAIRASEPTAKSASAMMRGWRRNAPRAANQPKRLRSTTPNTGA
jgi:hypothetical protein